MSNKIDVEKGDTWGLLRSGNMVQYRGATWRLCGPDRGTGAWSRATGLGPDIGEQSVSERVAVELLKGWGYSITTPAAKDEAPAKTEPTPGVFHLKCPQCCFVCKPDGGWVRRMCGCKHEDALVRVDGPLVLPERKPTPDVPVVDAVWVVEQSLAGPNKRLTAYPTIEDASKATIGKPYIVRLAPDADLAATVKRVEERLAKLEAATTAEVRHVRSEMIVGGDCTRAKVLVVAPKTNQWVTDDSKAVEDGRDWQWIDTLMRQGIDVVKEAGK